MATWRVNNSTLLGGEVCAQWQPNHAYSLGARCVCRTSYGPSSARAYVYECTTAGTSHATTEPTWPTSGTVTDGGVTWTCRIPNDGDWANASCILHYVLCHSSIAAGDTVYIDDGHSESVTIGTTAQYQVRGGSSKNNPIKVLCVDKADDSLSSGAVIADGQTSVYYPMLFTYYGYSYGVKYTSESHIRINGAGTWIIDGPDGFTVFSVANSRLLGANAFEAGGYSFIISGDIEFRGASAYLSPYTPMWWKKGTLIAASGVTKLITGSATYASRITIENVDLSAMGNNTILNTPGVLSNVHLRRCKMPSSFTPCSGTWYGGYGDDIAQFRMHHCDNGNTTYNFYEENYCGSCQDETTIVRTGGASDGTTGIAVKMVSSANTKEANGYQALISPPITGWTDSTSSTTFTIELVHDSATALQDDEIWMELAYPADNSCGLGALASSVCANLGTPADIPDSSETWTTTGMSNPNTRKLSVTVAPGKAGPITAKVYLAKASTTVYIDPIITES